MIKRCLSLVIVTLLTVTSWAAAKPNIVLVLVDDLGYGDIGCFGSTKNRTPNLDRMASEGARLTSFYAAPVCTPSRTQIMTGCYAKRVSLPMVLFPSSPIGLNPEETTVAEVLRDAGYKTMAIGKWHLGDQPRFLPTAQGFDSYLGVPYSNDMEAKDDRVADTQLKLGPVTPVGITRGPRPPLPLVRDGAMAEALDAKGQDNLTGRYTAAAVEFIEANRKNPFFLYFAHTAVHVPLHPGDRFRGKSANGNYGDWVEEVDWSVGEVLKALRGASLDKNTLVIFTSDNGPWLTQGERGGSAGPLRDGKTSTWEGGVRVPTIAWWPGRIAGGVSHDQVLGNVDFLPTFAAVAGGRLPERKIDGVNMWPVLAGGKSEVRDYLHIFRGDKLEAVRSGPWKLSQPGQTSGMMVKPEPPTTERLYNLKEDIGETRDVLAAQPETASRLRAEMARVKADLGLDGADAPGVRPPGRVEQPAPLHLPGVTFEMSTNNIPPVKEQPRARQAP
jgi:arylsulfatase A